MRTIDTLATITLAMTALLGCNRDEPYHLDLPDSRVGDRTSVRMRFEIVHHERAPEHVVDIAEPTDHGVACGTGREPFGATDQRPVTE